MFEKILKVIDEINFCFLFVMLSAINDRSDLKLVVMIMIVPTIWIIVRGIKCGYFGTDEVD